jgi:hypothetical protein
MKHATISAYELPDGSRIEACKQLDGSIKWAVRKGCGCLNTEGQEEYEPMPSGRDDEFLSRCRFPSAEIAYSVWVSVKPFWGA